MNIKFNYLYRDAGNYKSFHSIVFGNPFSLDISIIEEQIVASLIEEEYFLPQQWNVPLIYKLPHDPALDHDWYEFESISSTEEEVTEEFTIDVFLNNLK
jgi:hypothetical protein